MPGYCLGSLCGTMLPREAQSVSIPPKVVPQHRHHFIQNCIGHIDAEHPGAGHAEKTRTDAAEFQSRHVDVCIQGGAAHSAPFGCDDFAPRPDDIGHIGQTEAIWRDLSGLILP